MAQTIMAQTKPPIIGTAVTAWEDAFRAIGAMPLVAGTAFVIVILMALASFWIISDPYALAESPWLPVYSIVTGVVQGLLLAPLAIAVHRYVLLGEATSRYPLDPFSARYVRFVGFAILIKILWSLPSLIQSFMRKSPEETGVEALLGFVELALFIVVARCYGSARHPVSGHRGRCAGRDLEQRAARHQGQLLARGLHLRLCGGAGHDAGRLALLGAPEWRLG